MTQCGAQVPTAPCMIAQAWRPAHSARMHACAYSPFVKYLENVPGGCEAGLPCRLQCLADNECACWPLRGWHVVISSASLKPHARVGNQEELGRRGCGGGPGGLAQRPRGPPRLGPGEPGRAGGGRSANDAPGRHQACGGAAGRLAGGLSQAACHPAAALAAVGRGARAGARPAC